MSPNPADLIAPPPGAPNVVKAKISKAPASLTDELRATVDSFHPHRDFQIRFWMPRVDASGDTVLPAEGDAALVAFAEDGEPWLVAWR